MRHVIESRPYRKDLKRAGRGIYSRIVEEELPVVIDMLANDEVLPLSYRDHALHGNWEGSRDCHIRPDLLLVYTLKGDDENITFLLMKCDYLLPANFQRKLTTIIRNEFSQLNEYL